MSDEELNQLTVKSIGLASIVIGEMALHPLFWIEDYNGRLYFRSLKN